MRAFDGVSRTIGRRARVGLGVAALSLAAMLAGAVHAQTFAALPKPGTIGTIETTGIARPVRAWVTFCERYPQECGVDARETTTITLTSRVWRALNIVNRKVNDSVKPATDNEHWGIVDRWDLAEDGSGDCEDYQLYKRKVLAEQFGLSRRAMRMTVVIDEQGEGHAVLMVRTDEGELILDNKRGAILPWHKTGYVFVKREGQDGLDWVSLGDRSSPITTANR